MVVSIVFPDQVVFRYQIELVLLFIASPIVLAHSRYAQRFFVPLKLEESK